MKRLRGFFSILFPCACILVLVLDSKTALKGAQQGLEVCINTVIPSLFPFFILSILLTGTLSLAKLPIITPIRRICKMPEGTENLLISGFLGGYPVGAKCIYESWKAGQISKAEALRCLGFCNNAGPAFVFGMCGALFSEPWVVWVLWGTHIVSALIAGNILPIVGSGGGASIHKENMSLSTVMVNSITAMAVVCGWVVLFRITIGFSEKWFLWALPENCSIFLIGTLELANGCLSLFTIESEGLRFIFCSVFLGMGGFCIALQTSSVVRELGFGMYFPGKALQSILSCCFALLFSSAKYGICSPIAPAATVAILLALLAFKKTVAFPKHIVYNEKKKELGGSLCYSGRKSQNPAAIAPVELK